MSAVFLLMFLDPSFLVLGAGIAVAAVLIGLVIYFAIKQYQDSIQGTQHLMSDKELLLHIDSLPDKFIRKKDLVDLTGMTSTQASYRLQLLHSNGMIRAMYTDGFKTYYTLKSELDKRPAPVLSEAPFLTAEDILCIMQHFDYQVSMNDFVVATGLPVYILKKELQYFIKEKMITKLTSYDASGSGQIERKFYILQEPFRSNPERFLAKEHKINIELEKVYNQAQKKYDGLV